MLRARVYKDVLDDVYRSGLRERERVTNYLDLPNNFVTNLQENDAVPAMSSLHLYDMKKSFSQCLSFVC